MDRDATIFAFPAERRVRAREGHAEVATQPVPAAAEPSDLEPCIVVYDGLIPGTDPGAQIRAGAFRYVGPVIKSPDYAMLHRPGRILVDAETGEASGPDLAPGASLATLLGYDGLEAVPHDLVLHVGDRFAVTLALRGAGQIWHGDHVAIPQGERDTLRDILLHGLRVVAAMNAERLDKGQPRLTWSDLFPAIRQRITVEVDGQ